jgi:hypothetical protein
MGDGTPNQASPEQNAAQQSAAGHEKGNREEDLLRLVELLNRAGRNSCEPAPPTEEFRQAVISYRSTRITLANPGSGGPIERDRIWRLPPINETATGQPGYGCRPY